MTAGRKSKGPSHNTHMLIPARIWELAKKRADRAGATITEIVVEALEVFLGKKGL
ncbi:MAG: hypothetical protein MUQ56_06260 [Thermoleophilia bacterium]|nr:hypothetical protein [Thermoleophilia bacterium]